MIQKLLLALILLSFNLYADDLEDALKAYKSGDKQKAIQLYTKTCDGNDRRGCYGLGLLYSTGEGVKQDKQKAAQLFTKACDGNDRRGCFTLGFLYSKGVGVKQDKSIAKKLFGKACDGGIKSGCYEYHKLSEQ